jgi:hypothetical protein
VNLKVVNYLKDVGFFLQAHDLAEFDELPVEYFSTDVEPRETMQVLTPIRSHQDVRPISDRFANYLERDLRFERELVDEMWAVMVEMIENVPHHAYPGGFPGPIKEGFVNIQYLPNVEKLYFSVGDLGVGIRGSLEGCCSIQLSYGVGVFRRNSSIRHSVSKDCCTLTEGVINNFINTFFFTHHRRNCPSPFIRLRQ